MYYINTYVVWKIFHKISHTEIYLPESSLLVFAENISKSLCNDCSLKCNNTSHFLITDSYSFTEKNVKQDEIINRLSPLWWDLTNGSWHTHANRKVLCSDCYRKLSHFSPFLLMQRHSLVWYNTEQRCGTTRIHFGAPILTSLIILPYQLHFHLTVPHRQHREACFILLFH